MGQNICSVGSSYETTIMSPTVPNEPDIIIEQDGDNPSKLILGNKFLKTQINASWSILQQKNFMNDSQKSQKQQRKNTIKAEQKSVKNEQMSQFNKQKQNKVTQPIRNSLIYALTSKKYRQNIQPEYQNIEVDVSSFIKIKTQNINDYYQFKQKVGQGTFGNVYRGIQKRTGQIRAIKALKKKSMTNNSKMCLIAQLDLLKTLDHPNIIKLYDLYFYDGNYYVITQFCQGGCLQKYWNKKKDQIDEDMIKIIMKQLISVLSYLYNCNVVHRDLKLENIVFLKNQSSQTKDYQIKIIDFGTAIKVQKHQKNKSGLVGTLYYIAPQFTKGFFTQKCDIWSAGIILYLLLFHQHPFKGKNQKQILNAITSKPIQWQKLTNKYPRQALQVLKGMLDKNYLSRFSAKLIMQSQWLRQTKMSRASKQMSQNAASNLSKYNRKNNFVSVIQSFLCFKKITQQQRQDLSKMFFQIDNDHSGLIQIQQLMEFLKKKFPLYTEQNIKDIVQNLDKNNSGKIDFNEFITAMVQKTQLFAQSALKQAFQYIDNDKTGYITKLQIKKLLKAADKKQIQQLVTNLDQNGDNKISFQEFKLYFRNN